MGEVGARVREGQRVGITLTDIRFGELCQPVLVWCIEFRDGFGW